MDSSNLKPVATSTPLNNPVLKKRQLDRSNSTPKSYSSPVHKNMKVPTSRAYIDSSASTLDDVFLHEDSRSTGEKKSEQTQEKNIFDESEKIESLVIEEGFEGEEESYTNFADKKNSTSSSDNSSDIDEEESDAKFADKKESTLSNDKSSNSGEEEEESDAKFADIKKSTLSSDNSSDSEEEEKSDTQESSDKQDDEEVSVSSVKSVDSSVKLVDGEHEEKDDEEVIIDESEQKEKSEYDLQMEEVYTQDSDENEKEATLAEDEEEKEVIDCFENIETSHEVVVLTSTEKNTARGPPLITPHKIEPLTNAGAGSSSQAVVPVISTQHGRMFGGAMTDERMMKITGVSNDVVNAMHKSLSTVPENIATEGPKGLRVELLPHQKTGLTWLLWREQQLPPSGILADDMGLGKTLSLISLILHKKCTADVEVEEHEKRLRRHYIIDRHLVASNATLVIAPASLIYQWEKEVRDRVVSNKLSVFIFHGPKNKRDISAYRLAKYDIVITTYELLVSELKGGKKMNLIGHSSDEDDDSEEASDGYSFKGKKSTAAKQKPKKKLGSSNSVLREIAWERIILDEAHDIRNKASQKSRACCSLEAVHRWCLTGTPIHNKLWDFYSLIRFLRVTPFSEEKMWKEFIDNNSKKSSERLNTIVKSILLRRTKTQKCPITNKPMVDLTQKNYELVSLELGGWEKHCYSIMFEASKQKVSDMLNNAGMINTRVGSRRKPLGARPVNPFLAGGSGSANKIGEADYFKVYSCILVLLLRLRQACVHMSLMKDALDMDAFKVDSDEPKKGTTDVLEASFAHMSLDESALELATKDENEEIEKIFQRSFASTKVVAILERLNPIVENKEKCVIVSQWTSMLDIIEYHLKQLGVKYTSITGSVKTEDRQTRIDSFNKIGGGPTVMLLSLTAGGVGLNLIGGNHLFLVDLHWNPALEQQSCDRIHRFGQTKDVFIHKFVCADTIEQRVLSLQEKKTVLATSVLEGAASKKLTKLTKDELMFLFELDKASTQRNAMKTRQAAEKEAAENNKPEEKANPK